MGTLTPRTECKEEKEGRGHLDARAGCGQFLHKVEEGLVHQFLEYGQAPSGPFFIGLVVPA
jgi:hypothetical protein